MWKKPITLMLLTSCFLVGCYDTQLKYNHIQFVGDEGDETKSTGLHYDMGSSYSPIISTPAKVGTVLLNDEYLYVIMIASNTLAINSFVVEPLHLSLNINSETVNTLLVPEFQTLITFTESDEINITDVVLTVSDVNFLKCDFDKKYGNVKIYKTSVNSIKSNATCQVALLDKYNRVMEFKKLKKGTTIVPFGIHSYLLEVESE